MPKRSSNQTRPTDSSLPARQIVEKAIGEPLTEPKPGKNPAAVALGKLGGAKGGKARAENLSPRRRKEIAKKAAIARWEKLRNKN